jgi:cellulose synthase/poly-beta-1,6-N-acetylglucosamine synthase-like glycosyltransferase
VSARAAATDRPFWSVMIPTYNTDDLLAEALARVLAQDPGPQRMQICVVDDASSTGDARAVVERIGGRRVQFVRQPHNVGAPTNFTTCVRRATGQWVHLLHADDLIDDGFYDAYHHCIVNHPCVMVAGQSRIIDAQGEPIGRSPILRTADGLLVDARQQIALNHPLNFAAVVVARSAYEQVGGFDPALVHANDWDMWCRLASIGSIAVIEGAKATFRRHPETDTEHLRQAMTWLTDSLAAIDRIAEGCPDAESARRVRSHTRGWLTDDAAQMAERCVHDGRRRLALRNALWALRLDPAPARLRWVIEIIGGMLR